MCEPTIDYNITAEDIYDLPTFYPPSPADFDCVENNLSCVAANETQLSADLVVNTLFKLRNLKFDEHENYNDVISDLCLLWNKSREQYVINCLLSVDALDIFSFIIEHSRNIFLTKLVLDIITSMCNQQQTLDVMYENKQVIKALLELTSCNEWLVMESLMRLIYVLFLKLPPDQLENMHKMVLQVEDFVENICVIFNNAFKPSLVLQQLVTLDVILSKFVYVKFPIAENESETLSEITKRSFQGVFVIPEVIESTIEAFKILLGYDVSQLSAIEAQEMARIKHKTKETFCHIHSILSQYQQTSQDAYKNYADDILSCYYDMLQPLSADGFIITWHPFEEAVFKTLHDVLMILPKLEVLVILEVLLKLFYNIGKEIERISQDFMSCICTCDNQINYQICYNYILDILHIIVLRTDKSFLKFNVLACTRKYCIKLLQSFEQPYPSGYKKFCYKKLKEALDE